MGDSGGSPVILIWKKWSMTQRLSIPASSAVWAMREMVGPNSVSGTGQEKLLILMPTFIGGAP
jgi:hypothetical protein